jgi:hypothetical protein
MKDRKINVDRPQLDANEIMAGKNFEAIMRSHQMMSKPFYKQTWFYGTTGLASLGLIIGGTLAFQNAPDSRQELKVEQLATTEVSKLEIPTSNLFVADGNPKGIYVEKVKNTVNTNPQNQKLFDKNTTQSDPKNTKKNLVNSTEQTQVVTVDPKPLINAVDNPETVIKNEPIAMELYPRISGKMGGSISRSELLNNKGITTEADVNIIHFELHLIDGLGGKVFVEDGNQLNYEMKNALKNAAPGETIYFENIRGKIKNGTEVRLEPLRYVLMN